MNPSELRLIDGEEIGASVDYSRAADALEAALRDGFDPETAVERTQMAIGDGQMLVMPAAVGAHAGVKLATVGGEPRIQGVMIVFATDTLAPSAVLDGVAVTEIRTAAVSLLAARRLVRSRAIGELVVFGRGPQGRAHEKALRSEFELGSVRRLHSGSTPAEVGSAVSVADLICCATTARRPLFEGDLVKATASVIAVGSHEPTVREVDAELVARARVVVESRRSALAEAGDLLLAGLDGAEMTTLAELVRGEKSLPEDGPRFFKSTGMSWEDTVLAGLILGDASPGD